MTTHRLVEATGQAASTSQIRKENPVSHFELAAKQLLALEIEPADKGRRLYKLSLAINHYLERLDAEIDRRAASGREGSQAALKKVRDHLAHLAQDSRHTAAALTARSNRGSRPKASPATPGAQA